MLARLALDREEADFVAICRQAAAELYPKLTFSEEQTRITFRNYLANANPVIWVAEEKGRIVGFLMAEWGQNAFFVGNLAEQRLVYITPENRGTRAAAQLFHIFKVWACQLGATEIRLGSAIARRATR